MEKTTIVEAMNWRYAVQKFDSSKKLTDEQITSLLNVVRLSASAFGIEPWHIVVVSNPEVRTKLQAAAFGQAKVAEASHLLVITHKTDVTTALEDHLVAMMAATGSPRETFEGYIKAVTGVASTRDAAGNNIWMAKQSYLALGTLLETAALMGIDAGPMEGFNQAEVDEILSLTDKGLTAATLVAIGHRDLADPAAARPKSRMSLEQFASYVR